LDFNLNPNISDFREELRALPDLIDSDTDGSLTLMDVAQLICSVEMQLWELMYYLNDDGDIRARKAQAKPNRKGR
jgi:hypothetical protein